MAENSAIEKLEKQNFALELGTQSPDQDKAEKKADAKLFHESTSATQAVDEGSRDKDYGHVYYDSAEDADDEIDTEDDFEIILPLNIKKVQSGKASDQVRRSTSHPKQTTQTTAHTHGLVEWADNLAQAQKNSAKASHTAPTALEHNLPQASTDNPEPSLEHQFPDLLYPSPPLRRRKGSMALRNKTSNSASAHDMMSQVAEDQDTLYSNDQDRTAEHGDVTHLNPTHRGKMPEARNSQNAFSSEDHSGAAQSSETSTSSENHLLKHKTSGFPKAAAMLGYSRGDKVTPKKTITDPVTSPKASHGKKSLRNFFHRKGSTEGTNPPSSSGKAAGRMTISAPALVDASPNAKFLLNSASSLVDASPSAKNVVNYSRPIAPHSSSDVSDGSPVVRGLSSSALPGSNPFSGPSINPGGLTDKSDNIRVGLNTSSIYDHSGASAVRDNETAEEHGAVAKAIKKKPDDSDSDSFNPSDYSGDENSVQQAVAVPIRFSGKAKLVNVRPPRGTNSAASSNQSGAGMANAPITRRLTDYEAAVLGAQDANPYRVNAMIPQVTRRLTDQEAAVLGAQDANRYHVNAMSPQVTRRLTDQEAAVLGVQDAERYLANAMNSQTRPTATTNTDDPFIDPPYRKLLAKPANEIAAKEMARIKAAREAGKTGGGLLERMNALLAKGGAKPGVENTGHTITGPRTNTGGESRMSKMRELRKKPKQGSEEEDSEEEVLRQVEAGKEKALREEEEIHAKIKAKLAAKDAANGGIRGAGFPRIDYGEPSVRTALGGCVPTDEERAHAGRAQKKGVNTTARGQFEGY